MAAFVALLAIAGARPSVTLGKSPMALAAVHDDVHSLANPNQVRVTHLDLDLTADFERQVLRGTAMLQLDRQDRDADLVLDTHDLVIRQVTQGNHHEPTDYRLGEQTPHLGRALTVPLDGRAQSVRVQYETSPQSKALQWLDPRQTAGGKQPFLFSQSQAILARTWIPCQDSPGVRMTYKAIIRVPKRLMAVMSATNPQTKSPSGTYRFEMKQAIPSYLVALAIGDLEFRAIGKRSGIYAEPSVVEAAAWEFSQTERMMSAAEQLYGPYRWDRYDVLVLPPSFPFGGMENPRLTFATPTVLAGDRSLVSLIAHELAHSWSGNLVTNATWNDIWLNEGFTVYFEHRIMEAVNGRDFDEMGAQLGKQSLLREMAQLPRRDTWLQLNLAGRNPDDGLTDVAYEKGYLFLRMLEEALGRQRWDAFLRSYFDRFAFQSMTTDGFLSYLRNQLPMDDALYQQLKIEDWVYGPGLPKNDPEISADQLQRVVEQVQRFEQGLAAGELAVEDWTTHHWLHFLRSLHRPLDGDTMKALDAEFEFSSSRNSEILHDWLLHSIAANYLPAMPALESFLTRQGRRKFLVPLYQELVKTDAGRQRARTIYAKARPLYHSLSADSLDRLLDWSSR